MSRIQLTLKPEQHAVLATWLPEDHAASVARLNELKDRSRRSQQQPQDKESFARLQALESAACAALWVLKRLPPDLHQKQQLDATAVIEPAATVSGATVPAPRNVFHSTP